MPHPLSVWAYLTHVPRFCAGCFNTLLGCSLRLRYMRVAWPASVPRG